MDMPAAVKSIFAEEMIAKFMATQDEQGKVNLAAILTLQPPEDNRDDRLIFGEFLMWKSRKNIQKVPRVAAAAVNLKLKMASLTGDFKGFENKGKYLDYINNSSFFKYNAYTGARQAGIVDVRETGEVRKASYLGLALDMLAMGLKKLFTPSGEMRKGIIPSVVMEKFVALQSVKALAIITEDGYPRIFPVMTVGAWGRDGLLIKISKYNQELKELQLPVTAALCVLTMKAVSYQVKGILEKDGHRFLRLRAEEVYSSSPPLAGKRIYPPED